MSRAVSLMVSSLLSLGAAGCGTESAPSANQEGPVTQPPSTRATPAESPQSRSGVLFDEPWTVEEGVWFIAARGDFPAFGRGGTRQSTGLLDVVDSDALGAIVVNGPALYGRYDVRVELRPTRPAVPNWCEDVVEVAYEVGSRPLVMGSFESSSGPMAVPAGDYRVRYCVRGLDAAAAETAESEFDGDDYRLYTGRHLFQLWEAPLEPERVVRLESDFATSQGRGA